MYAPQTICVWSSKPCNYLGRSITLCWVNKNEITVEVEQVTGTRKTESNYVKEEN